MKTKNKLRKILTQIVSGLGYEEVSPFTYKATWDSGCIEHYLEFSLFGAPGKLLGGDYGLRCKPAQDFGYMCAKKFGHPVFRSVDIDGEHKCFVSFSFGRLGQWPIREALDLYQISEETIIEPVSQTISLKLFPIIKPISTAKTYMDFLVGDEDYSTWFKGSAIMRLAQIAFLCRKLDFSREASQRKLFELAEKARWDIGSNRIDEKTYIEAVIHEAFGSLH